MNQLHIYSRDSTVSLISVAAADFCRRNRATLQQFACDIDMTQQPELADALAECKKLEVLDVRYGAMNDEQAALLFRGSVNAKPESWRCQCIHVGFPFASQIGP